MTNEELVKRIRGGERELMVELYEQNRGFILTVIQRAGVETQNYEDAMQDAYIGLHMAVKGFDERMGNKFISYAAYHLQHAIHSGQHGAVYMPEHARNTARQIKTAYANLLHELDREPTAEDIIKHTGFTADTVNNIYNAIQPAVSIFAPMTGSDDIMVGDNIADDRIDFENDVAASDERRYIRKIIAELPDDEREIINCYYMQGMTYAEIGRAKGLDVKVVRTLVRRGLQTLRNPRFSGRLADEYNAV